METPRRPRKPSTPTPGEHRAWRPSMGYLLIAAVLAVSGIGYWLLADSSPAAGDGSATTANAATDNGKPAASGMAAWPMLASVFTSQNSAAQDADTEPADRDPTPDLSDYVPKGAKPTMNEVIERLHKEGIHTGLGAFNPPGTRPPKIGLAVPEGYPLPDGYVRHYQATDDGQRIEPILMFAPDKQIFDANNKPIEIPADRVVPPELAPPGFPIRRIEIPPPVDGGRSTP